MKLKSITSTLAVLSLSATLALADDKPATTTTTTTTPATTTDAAAAKPKHDPAEQFKKLDTNGDGKLSKEEFMASKHAQKDPAKAEALFKKLDKDGDGFLTLEEFSARGAGKKGEAAAATTDTTAPAPKADAAK